MESNFMLCQKIDKEQAKKEHNQNYVYQIKVDGERAFIHIENKIISKIINRRGFNILKQFPEFQNLVFKFESGIIDSEIIVNANGKNYGDFNGGLAFRSHLQDEQKIKERAEKLRAKIMVFDIIELNKEGLRFKPLTKRYEILRENIADNDLIEVLKNYDSFAEIWAIVEKEKLEGCIRKHKNTAYEFIRSKFQNKIKNWKEEVIEFNAYEIAVSSKESYYKGITLKNNEGIRVSCMGKKSEEIKKIIDEKGSVKVVCQYLEKTENKSFRFISFKEVLK